MDADSLRVKPEQDRHQIDAHSAREVDFIRCGIEQAPRTRNLPRGKT